MANSSKPTKESRLITLGKILLGGIIGVAGYGVAVAISALNIFGGPLPPAATLSICAATGAVSLVTISGALISRKKGILAAERDRDDKILEEQQKSGRELTEERQRSADAIAARESELNREKADEVDRVTREKEAEIDRLTRAHASELATKQEELDRVTRESAGKTTRIDTLERLDEKRKTGLGSIESKSIEISSYAAELAMIARLGSDQLVSQITRVSELIKLTADATVDIRTIAGEAKNDNLPPRP